MRNNKIHRPNVVTRRAATEPTDAVNRYRGVRPNNNNNDNNNHATLAERFQPSTLHKLRQLGCLYTNTNTPNTVHQLDAEAVAAKVAYIMTNTQPSCSGGGKPDRIPNALKGVMSLPQTERWKAVSGNYIASLEKHGVFKLIPIPSG